MNRYLLMATCIILLACVTIVSAESYNNIDENIVFKKIQQGHTIFFGEENVDVTECMDGYEYVVSLNALHNVTDHIRIPDRVNFSLPTDKEETFWYQAVGPQEPVMVNGEPVLAFTTQEPVLEFEVWNLNADMKADSKVQRGTLLQFKFSTSTNLEDITNRTDWIAQKEKVDRGEAPYESLGYVNVGLTAPDGQRLLELMTLAMNDGSTKIESTKNLVLGALPGESTTINPAPAWVWPKNWNSQTANPKGWMTGWRDAGTGQETDYHYKVGSYDVTAVCNVNNMFKNRELKKYTWDSHQVELTPRSVTVSVTPPTTGKSRDAQFTATITGMPNSTYEVFIYDECPPKITGKICDRPPFIYGTRDELSNQGIKLDPVDGSYDIGNRKVVDCCTEGMLIRQAVPSGDAFPSQGDWDIFEKGTRYYAEVTTGPDGTVTVPFWIDTTVKPGTFTIQAQDILYNMRSTATISVPLGTITGATKDPSGALKTEFFLGDEIWIDGTNSDSNMTYIWLTGPGLNPCGVNLFSPLDSKDPVKAVVLDTKDGVANYWRVEPNWDTGAVPIGEGKYTIWMASVDPDCRFCQCDSAGEGSCGFGDCFGVACEEGVCSLLNCPECAAVTSIDITLVKPDLTATVNDTTRCCCPGYPCGQLGGVQEIWVQGSSGGNSCKQLQVWLFGQSQFGLKNYLMAVTPIYCDGTYKFELNKGLLQANGIDLCSIATGKYDVIVQAPGTNNNFDIRLGEPESTGDRFVLTTMPTDDSKLFKIEGKDSLYAGVAVKALIDGFNQPGIDDLYAHVIFELKDKACEGNVDFTADKTQGNAPLSVQFTDKSVMKGVSWAWTANGEPFSTEQNPKKVFDKTGKYTIELTVTDAEGVSNTATKDSYINVISGPIADFSFNPASPLTGETVQFSDESLGSPASWEWMFGDGTSSSVQSPAHVYYLPGTYNVTLTVSDKFGSSIASKSITVTGNPISTGLIADFTVAPASAYAGDQVQFTDKSTGGTPTSWQWEFGDNSTSSLQSPVHVYQKAGTYQVILNVGDSRGVGVPKIVDYLVMNDAPVAAFSAEPLSSEFYPVQVEFTDESTGVVDEWNWQLVREGQTVATSSEENPTITFTIPGIYTVTLTVKNNGGSNSTTKDNYITIGTGSQFVVEQGWNHVSVPMAVTDNYNTVSKLFNGIQTGGVPYAAFNNAANEWVNVTDDYPVKPLEALRVWKEDPGSIVITPDYTKGGIFTRDLKTGWNGIGIMAMQPTPASVALASLGEAWNKTLMFNPLTQRWEYPIIRGVDDDKFMYPTVGYLIEMNTDGILIGGE